MAVSPDRRFTKEFVYALLVGIRGKTLGEIDKSRQFDRTLKSDKITGIAGDVIEQSVFGFARDSRQECDIEIDSILTELKTTGVRIPKNCLAKVKGKVGDEYNKYLTAKEGISVTAVTFEPAIQTDFDSSHFWEKSRRLLLVFYEYKSYDVVPASQYAAFPVVDFCYNSFSDTEKAQLQSDWELVRDYLQSVYDQYPDKDIRYAHLERFTHVLRPNLLLIELVPSFKRNKAGTSYQKPRYRLKKTFVDYIVKGHFAGTRLDNEIQLDQSFSSFADLDRKCHELTQKFGGLNFGQLKNLLNIDTDIATKDFGAKCILKMFDAKCNRLNQIADFNKAGIIAKTITLTPKGGRTEDMKLTRVDFEEWTDRDVDFENSDIYSYFSEHSFLCPIFCEHEEDDPAKSTFEGFKRFAFPDDFIENDVQRTWSFSRRLIYNNELEWEYVFDKEGNPRRNKSGSYMGAPNLPKSERFTVFFRGGSNDSSEESRTDIVNGIKMLPQFIWLKGSYIVEKLKTLPYL